MIKNYNSMNTIPSKLSQDKMSTTNNFTQFKENMANNHGENNNSGHREDQQRFNNLQVDKTQLN